jgi:cystathionine beta-synthase
VKVTDKDAAIMTRRLAREEGLFIGWSCGSAVFGALEYAKENLKEDDVMVIILPDHGTRYLGKIYNDNWMKDHGFLEERKFATAKDIVAYRKESAVLKTLTKDTKVGAAILMMNQNGIDQVPVVEGDHFVGSLNDTKVLKSILDNPAVKDQTVGDIMDNAFQFVSIDSTIDVMSSLISKDVKALMVRDHLQKAHIITQSDLLMAIAE